MGKTMKISVIIPCYNGEEFLGQAIGSLLEQSRRPDEIIVVDDGSDDRSAEIALSFGDPVVVLSKPGGGAPRARNSGASYASGDALMFFDADDVMGPMAMESLADLLEEHPDGIAACPWFRLDKAGDEWVRHPPSCTRLQKGQDYLSGWINGWYHPPCSVLWSRTAYEKNGGWDPLVTVNQDGDHMMRALADGSELWISRTGSAFYRRMPAEEKSSTVSGGQFSRSGRESQIYVLKKIAHRLEERGTINHYRKPLTIAFEKFRGLCEELYPELSQTCSELITLYGEPVYVRLVRNIQECMRYSVRYGFGRTRKVMGRVKNSLFYTRRRDTPVDEKIDFGIESSRKVLDAPRNGFIVRHRQPGVSVVLAAGNHRWESLISLKSVLTQTYSDFEVLVPRTQAENGSHMELPGIVDDRIRYITEPHSGLTESQYLIAVRNHCLRVAKGEFLTFLEPGDEWIPERLEKQLRFFRNMSGKTGLVTCTVTATGDDGSQTVHVPDFSGNFRDRLLAQNVIPVHNGVMLRREVTASTGFFDQVLHPFEFHDYWLRMSQYHEFEIFDEPLVRIQGGGTHAMLTSLNNESGLLAYKKKHQKKIADSAFNRVDS